MRRAALLAPLLCFGMAPEPSPPAPIVAATVAALPPYVPGPPVTGIIRLWGHGSPAHDFVGEVVRRWFAAFRKSQPGVSLDYRMYGTASAIGALATGAGTLALLGEEISPEAERLFRRARGYPPTRVEVANGAVDVNYFDYAHMIFVNRANPLARLTARQLEGVFGAGHRCVGAAGRDIRTWGQLGLTGDWAARPIVPYAWKTDIDFALFFRERILCGSQRWNPATREFMPVKRADGSIVQHGQLILEALAKDPAGIAVSNTRFANPEVRALPLAWDARGPFVDATPATLIARRYPLGRIIPAYVDRPPGRPAPAAEREFLRFVLSREGQAILVEHSGYLPLDRASAARALAVLR